MCYATIVVGYRVVIGGTDVTQYRQNRHSPLTPVLPKTSRVMPALSVGQSTVAVRVEYRPTRQRRHTTGTPGRTERR